MKIPDSAFAPMLQAVAASLPYSEPFEPVAPESAAIVDILGEIVKHDPTFESLEGFVYRIAEKTDKSPKKQEDTRLLLLRLIDKLQAYERNVALKGHDLKLADKLQECERDTTHEIE